MCGRFVLKSSLPEITAYFGIPYVPAPDEPGGRIATPRYNVAPGTQILAVGQRDGKRTLRPLKWGLVPSWAKDASIGNKLVNARAEGVESKPSFRAAIRKRRVLVPADGWYEWAPARPGERTKRPFFFTRTDGKLVALAGLWEFWRPAEDEAGEGLRTACLLTTEPNEVAATVHDRMPVTIDAADWDAWLDPETPLQDVLGLLRPAADGVVQAWPVSSAVSRVGNDGPELIERHEDAPNSA